MSRHYYEKFLQEASYFDRQSKPKEALACLKIAEKNCPRSSDDDGEYQHLILWQKRLEREIEQGKVAE